MVKEIKTEIKQKKNTAKRDYLYAVGKRREASARVRLYMHIPEGLMWGKHAISKEQILVNQMPIEHYFSGQVAKALYVEPLTITDSLHTYGFTIQVEGGGRKGQLDATIKGIANVLLLVEGKEYRPILKSKGFLTRDARIRERRKVGRAGKARKQKSSPKR